MRNRIFVLVAAVFLLVACTRLERDPAQPPADQARVLLSRGDTTKAIRYIEKVDLEKYGDSDLYCLLGSLYRTENTIVSRLRSQQLLERGAQRYSSDPRLLLELGKTYFAQTFYPDAARCFEAALDIDSTLCEAHYYLGLHHYRKWKRVNQYTDDLSAACREFSAVVACDPRNELGTIRYLYSLYALDRIDKAERVCKSALQNFPDVPELRMLDGVLAYEDGRFDDAEKAFTRGLGMYDDETRAEYDDIEHLLPYEERGVYRTYTTEKRRVVERSYWAEQDPDPTTPVNERRLEYVYRMFVADVFFSTGRDPIRGWETERGATLVKFGWPLKITSTLGDSWKSGRIENWFYQTESGDLRQFVFEDQFLNGNLRIPISADSMVWVLRYEPLESGYQPEAVEVPGAIDVVTFKNNELSSTVYIALAVEADSLLNAIDLERTDHFLLRGSLFNAQWVPERRFADTLWTSEVQKTNGAKGSAYVVLRGVNVPFDFYHLACTFADESGSANAIFKSYGDAYRYVGDGLVASDIVLRREDSAGGPFFERNGVRLYPNPDHEYSQGERLRLYMEVYNLNAASQRNDYDVSFYIFASPEETPSRWRRVTRGLGALAGLGDDRRPAIAQTIQRSSVGHSGFEDISINIDSLESGRYQLVVSIDDLISGDSAESTTLFYKRD